MTVKLLDTPRKAPLEKAVQSKIMKYLRSFEKFSGDVLTKNLWGSNGLADIVGCYDGKYVAIEVKRDKNGKPTPQQKIWLNDKWRVGGIIGVAYDIDSVKKIFEENQIVLDNESQNN